MSESPGPRRRRIGIVSVSAIPDDPRVRRQGDMFHQAGWDVVAIGLPGHRSPAPVWTCLEIDDGRVKVPAPSPAQVPETAEATAEPQPHAGAKTGTDRPQPIAGDAETTRRPVHPARKLIRAWVPYSLRARLHFIYRSTRAFAGRTMRALYWTMRAFYWAARAKLISLFYLLIWRHVRRARRAFDVLTVTWRPAGAQYLYWQLNSRFPQIYDMAKEHRVDFWLANDWTALPIARRLADEQGVPYGYDTHELAIDEYAQNLKWRVVSRPLISALEGQGIRNAAFTSCVSEGIADRLMEVYALPRRPLVIRSTPTYQPQSFKPVGDVVEVLYHGVVAPGRGLEACIRSVPLWPRDYRFTIRGPCTPAYRAQLREIAAAIGMTDRIRFDDPVPMTELVARAAVFDVGLFALPDHSLQNVYVLPNKFFEYTMAGLALCVSDLPEMTRLLRAHDLGELIKSVTPESIAEAIARLDRPAIERFKRNALAAAQALNWEVEGCKLLRACDASALR